VREVGHHMLKGTDKLRKKKTWKTTSDALIPDAETRYMDLDVRLKGGDSSGNDPICLEIVVACSDGVIRLFEFDSFTGNLQLFWESEEHSHALQRVAFAAPSCVSLGISHGTAIYAATDGFIRILSTHGETRSISEAAHPHNSGVNAWDFWGRFLITGGDDGAISITDLKNPVSQVYNFPGRHSAQIAGLRALPCRKSSLQSSVASDRSDFSIVTASVDQRITLWSVTNCGQELSKVHEALSHVGQIQSMTAWTSSEDLFVCDVGVGAQLFKIKTTW